MVNAARLEVVVFGGNQHIQRIGGVQQVVPHGGVFAKHRRLQQRGSVSGSDQAPRCAVRVVGCQRQQGRAPIGGGLPRLLVPCVVQRNGTELHQEGVPRVALVGAQGWKIAHLVGHHGGQELGQAGAVQRAAIGAAPADQRLLQQIPL